MPASIKISHAALLIALCAGCALPLQADGPPPQGASLQEHYDAAEQLLKANQLDQAAAQFRSFLSEAIGELAVGQAHMGDYAKAEPLLDEALELAPDSAQLRLEFASASLLDGDIAEAQMLSAAFLTDFPSASAASLAQAHQIQGRALLRTNHDKEGRKELETAFALNPTFANGYDLAVACLDMDDEKCAVQLFGDMEKSIGDTAELHMLFGRAYGNSDFAPRAVTEFKKAIADNPRQRGAHYCLAAAMLATGGDEATLQAAVAELKQELTISPNDSLTYAALGKIAATHLQYDEAERYLKRATALDPKSPDAFLYLGQMYFDTHDYAHAEPALRSAIRLTADPSHNRYQIQKAHYLLGRILMQQHHEEQAHAEMQTSRDLANKVLSSDKSELAGMLASASAPTVPGLPTPDPGVPAADQAVPSPALAAPDSTRPGNADPAAARTYHALEKQLAPVIADCYNNLGAITAGKSDFNGALDYFKRAGAWNPHLEGLDYNLGHAAFMASQFADAVAPLTRYVAAHPDNSSIRNALAISQFMARDYKGCVTTLKHVADLSAEIPQIQFVYADSLVKTGEVAAGKERLASLEAAHPEIPDVHRGLGEAFEQEGDTQNALREFQAAAGLHANDPETQYDLATLDLKQGNTDDAIRELQSATGIRPDDAEYHRLLAHAYNLALRMTDAEKETEIYQKLQTSQTPSPDSTEPAAKRNP